MGWTLALAGALQAGACASLREAVHSLAARQLSCPRSGVRLQPLGVLSLTQPLATLDVFEAEGCQQQRTFFCRARCCTADLVGFGMTPREQALVLRALHLRRVASRGRCPADDERMVQLSRTLFRFEACDGEFLLHCSAAGCRTLLVR